MQVDGLAEAQGAALSLLHIDKHARTSAKQGMYLWTGSFASSLWFPIVPK